jgi:hypothetical protein
MLPRDAKAFLLGVNYPWLRYAQDFGQTPAGHIGISVPETKEKIAQDFARIRDCGAVVVRWFVFGDGRGGFHVENGIPQRPDSVLFQDVAAALDLASQFQLKLCFSLIDYLWLQEHDSTVAGPHAHVLHSAAGREAFLQNVLIPLFREFRAHPALFAWEIANEPEWAIREFHPIPAAKMHVADFRVFATEIANAVHEYAEVPVTLGSARLLWVRAWAEVGLDFYQAHYYPASEAEAGMGFAAQLASLQQLERPLWIGELPVSDPGSSDYSLMRALNACRDADLYGAAVWRWTVPEPTGSDLAIGCVEPDALQAWSKSERAQNQRA